MIEQTRNEREKRVVRSIKIVYGPSHRTKRNLFKINQKHLEQPIEAEVSHRIRSHGHLQSARKSSRRVFHWLHCSLNIESLASSEYEHFACLSLLSLCRWPKAELTLCAQPIHSIAHLSPCLLLVLLPFSAHPRPFQNLPEKFRSEKKNCIRRVSICQLTICGWLPCAVSCSEPERFVMRAILNVSGVNWFCALYRSSSIPVVFRSQEVAIDNYNYKVLARI